ncbi:Assembly domain of cartilage oligomeric matrix protein [Dioscorea alata]|uniref:Assembly domain of cartilage oligomeric matrix protein n=1 Tax=Dioscorea alata TaxID=55571 RepID=A0ACB7VEK8_DIOAL|nr:Assembly domain of cartilage oligomeric matrix protein [Dioscorea alata]
MDDSGAILSQISAYKDLLDEVNEEIEQNIQKTREIESEIVKCLEVEKDSVTKESDLLKMLSMRDFELSGLVQIAATSRNSCESLACDLRLLQMNKDETIKRISQKRLSNLKWCTKKFKTRLACSNFSLTWESKKDLLGISSFLLAVSFKQRLYQQRIRS